MAIFWRLLLGHMLADFTLQTNFINAWKRKSTWGMFVHCAMHPLLYAALCLPFLNDLWVDAGPVRLQGWTCVLLIFILHYMEDEWRVFTIFRYKTPDNTIYFLWDQLIHWLCIFAFVPLGLSDYGEGGIFPEKWPVLGCLAVLVTHFCTVLIYFLEKDLFRGSYPGFDEKHLSMAERLVLWLFFLLPGMSWAPMALLWLGVMYNLRSRRILDFSWLSFYVGGSLTLLAGAAARYLYYHV